MDEITVREDFLVTPGQAAKLCGVKPDTVYQWIRRRQIPVARRDGGRLLLNLLDVARTDQALRARGRRADPASWRLEGEPDVDLLALVRACDAQVPASTPPQPLVYYLRFGDRIKIGTTVNLRSRLDALPHDAVLATEPGDLTIERKRHDQFAEYRLSGEWFSAAPPILAHIAQLTR